MRGRRQQQQTRFLQQQLWLPLLLLLFIFSTTQQVVVHGQILEVTSGSFMDNRDFAFCYQALQVSDTNGDNEVDKEEYVEFSRFLSPPGLLDGIVSFDELPLEYRSSFISTACLCSIPAFGGTSLAISDYTDTATVSQEDRCCFGVDAHIRVPTSSSSNSSNNPVSTLSSIDRAYLYAACAYTDSAAEIVLKENDENENNDSLPVVPAPSPPTPAPVPATPRPTTSKPTTAAPITAAVTAAPSTVAPVVTTAAPTTVAPITTVPPVVTTAAPTTVVATNAPTTAAPTPATAKTAMPTPAPLLVPAHVTYSIAVENDNDNDDNDEMVEGINTNGTINTNSTSSNSSAAIMNNNNNEEDDDDNDNAELLAVVSYLSDLQVALNRLAPVVARETFDGESENCVRMRRQLIQEEEEEDSQQQRPLLRRKTTQQHKKGRRSLQKQQIHCDDVQVKVQLPTKFGSVSDMECPAPNQLVSDPGVDFTSEETTLCRTIEAIAPMEISILFPNYSNIMDAATSETTLVKKVVREYEAALSQAIDDGRLQTQLDFVNPDSPVTILPPFNDTTTADDDDEERDDGDGGSTGITDGGSTDDENNLRPIQQLSSGAKAGIASGVLAFAILVPLLVYLMMRRQKRLKKKKEQDMMMKKKESDTKEVVDHTEEDVLESKGVQQQQNSAAAFSNSDSDGDVYLDESGSKSPTDSLPGLIPTSYGRNNTSPTAEIGQDTGADSTTDDDDDDEYGGGGGGGYANNDERALMIPEDARRSDDEQSSGSSSPILGGEATSAGGGANAAAAAGVATAATVAAIGAASRQKRPLHEENENDDRINDSSFTSDDQSSQPSIAQLESHIEAGDWAAVGATAAILAAASDSQSVTSRSAGSSPSRRRRQQSPPSSGSGPNSVDAARAAELDQLVDKGDWDGLIAAAAKFEDSEANNTPSSNASSRTSSSLKSSSRSATSGSDTGTGGSDNGTGGSGTGGSDAGTGGSGTIGTPSYGTSASESPSKAQRRDELRSEVEALVRRVVPEEIDNIDEMMNQFKGREEELVETLRTMQERSIAQKARSAGQKAAKAEARRIAKEQGHERQRGVIMQRQSEQGIAAAPPPPPPQTSTPDQMPITADALSPESKDSSAAASVNSAENKRTALELAIDSGDWQAVGEAAAILSDGGSMGTLSTGELDRLADASMSSVGTPSPRKGGRNRTSRSLEGIDAERASELDDLVHKGDWIGVMHATKRFNESDNKDKSTKPSSSPTKEEEEALKQAELWMKLAEKKKAEGSTDHAGASDAAEWAIQRSLSQMKEADAEKQKKLKSASAANADKEV